MTRSLSPALQRLVLNLARPLRGAGIRVRHIAADFRSVTVEMHLRRANRTASGGHFGGSLYAMIDPFFALMVARNLGPEYLVWDKAGSIDYIAAGRGRVWARLELDAADLEQITRMTSSGDKHLHLFRADIRDDENMLVARVEKMVYVRRKRNEGSA